MRQFNRIAGFVAVSFVLAFMGRVNKTGLYTVYFKTLADVEIRNSHALDLGDVHFDQALPTESVAVSGSVQASGFGDLTCGISLPSLVSNGLQKGLELAEDQFTIELRCFMNVAPRAPGMVNLVA